MWSQLPWSKLRKDFDKFSDTLATRKAREAKKAIRTNPPAPKKPKASLEDVHAEYTALRRRIIDAIADNYVLDTKGRETYRKTGSAYAVVGKYKVNSAFIDFDHDLRDVNTMPGGIERNRVLKGIAKRLGVRG